MTEKDRLRRVLSSAVDADVTVGPRKDNAWSVIVSGLKPSPRFLAIWVRRGWPSDVRKAIEHAPAATLVAAPAFSRGARELLADRALSWADETGGARIQTPGLIVRLEGEPISEPRSRVLSWSPVAARAAEAVLALAPAQITTAWLAEHARCSVPRASGILQQWDAERWTTKSGPARGRGASRAINDRLALLDAWTAHLNAKPLDRWFAHTTNRDLLEVQAHVTNELGNVTFAWTGWSAAAELAPYMTQLPVLHLRLDDTRARRDIEPALRNAGLTITDAAGRVELWRTNTDAFIYAVESARGPLCSWPRVYADLVRIGSRGVDAAQHLRDVMNSDR